MTCAVMYQWKYATCLDTAYNVLASKNHNKSDNFEGNVFSRQSSSLVMVFVLLVHAISSSVSRFFLP